jgi:hypothetical protein
VQECKSNGMYLPWLPLAALFPAEGLMRVASL